MKIYQAIAHNLYLRDAHYNIAWRVAADDRLANIIDNYLPHGSGFDITPEITHEGLPRQTYTISGSFHKMDEHGGYSGWVDFTITVKTKPCLVDPWDFDISCEDEDLSEYISDTYAEAFGQDYKF